MSQLLKYVGEAPVGAGIAALSGNGGFPGDTAVADGNNNVNIVGFGTINVARTGANTLTISSTGVPATYTTNNGIAVPNILGNLNVVGDPNITTDALIANTVTVRLNDNVLIPGGFIAGTNITAIGTGTFDYVNIVANGLDSIGPTILHSLNRGVVQVNAAHTLFSDEGLDGQILIGSTVGPAQWRNITAGSRITIVNTPNGIQINAVPQLPSGFHTDAGNAVPVAGILNILGGANIQTNGAGNTVGIALNDDILVNSVTTTGLVDPGIITGAGSSIQSGQDITAVGTIRGYDVEATDRVTTQDLYVNGITRLLALPEGVLQTNAVGLVQSTNSNHILPAPPINGQVLISGPVAPAWNALTSADGTVVINTAVANHIDLSAAGGFGSTAFKAVLTNNYITAPAATTIDFYLGQGAPGRGGGPLSVLQADDGYDGHPGGSYVYLGDGLGTPAHYTAPATGLYSFTMSGLFGSNIGNLVTVWTMFFYINGTHPYQYTFVPYYLPAPQNYLSPFYTQNIFLTAGNRVSVRFNCRIAAAPITFYAREFTSNQLGVTYFSGVRIG